MKLLVIDDEPHIRQMVRLTLEAAGYQVDEAAAGEAGLALYEARGGYDAVLLDQKMPGIDGLQTLKQLKEREPDVRVIKVTAFASIDLAVEAMRLGATDFLRKPANRNDNAVRPALDRQRNVARATRGWTLACRV